jgi:phosphatidylinositol glycan class V
MRLSHAERVLMTVAFGVRVCTLALSAVASAVVPAYDQSTSLLRVHWLLRGVASWDAVYMRHIALHGYTHEQTHAFYPLYPLGLLRPLAAVYRVDPLLAGVAVNVVAFCVATVVLYRLLQLLQLPDAASGSGRVAFLAAVAFCVTPAGIFFTAPYSECAFALASFSGMLAVLRRRRAVAVVAFAAAAALRSNGLLYGGFFLWPHALRVWMRQPTQWRALALDLLCVACVLAPMAGVEWYGRALYCSAGGQSELRPYCATWRPAFYSFIQAHYWNQGLFAYWTVQQLPNFALAAPMAALCAVACATAMRRRHFLLQAHAPHVLLLGLMLAVAVCGTHVQTLTRFVSASPVIYWYAGRQMVDGTRRQWILAYFASYTIAGSVLFASFYPWT